MSFIVFTLFSNYNFFGQNNYFEYNDNVLVRYQNGDILEWIHFRGKVDTNTVYGAMSTMGIGYYIEEYDSLVAINIGAYFNSDSSWVRSETTTGLIHENYHFKITEITKRLMMKELSEIQIKYNSLNDLLEDRLLNYSVYHDIEQRFYDRETNYGLDSLKQKEFQIKIDSQLEELNDYNKNYLLLFLNQNERIKFTKMSNDLAIE